jgi:hypothetical protein
MHAQVFHLNSTKHKYEFMQRDEKNRPVGRKEGTTVMFKA